MFGKCPKRITVFSSPRPVCRKSASAPITATNIFIFIVLFSIGDVVMSYGKSGSSAPPGVAEIRARLHSFKLEHYLHAPEDLIELILTKLGIGLAEIRPGVNIVNHQLEIVPVDVVIEATQDRIEAVVTLLSGV